MTLSYPPRPRRHSYTAKEREAALIAANGLCHLCLMAIEPGQDWEMSHVGIPHDFGGELVSPAHFRCHKIETSTNTAPTVAKARRERQRHNGSLEASFTLPCSRKSTRKAKIGGGVEPRVTLSQKEQARQAENPFLDFSAPPMMRRFIPTGDV